MAVRDKAKYIALGGGAIALGIGTYSLFRYLGREALIEEYVSETEDLENYYRQAAANGEISPSERELINHRIDLLEAKEEAIKSKGLVGDLVDALWATLGILVFGIPITLYAVKQILKRHQPPPPKCPKCEKPIQDWDHYQDHTRDEHVETPDESLWEAGIEKVAESGTILLAMISSAAGVALENLREGWDWFSKLPRWEQVVIILGIIAVCIIAVELSPLIAPEAAEILAAFGIAV